MHQRDALSFYSNDPAPPDIYTLSLHDALPISRFACVPLETKCTSACGQPNLSRMNPAAWTARSEEHTSELQSRGHLVCRLLLEKKNKVRISGLIAAQGLVLVCNCNL